MSGRSQLMNRHGLIPILLALPAASRAQSVSPGGPLAPGHQKIGNATMSQSSAGLQAGFDTVGSMIYIDFPAGTNWSGYTHLQFTIKNTGTNFDPMMFG